MHLSNRQHLTGLLLVSAWLLSACGGGGGSSSPNTGMYSVGGTLSGLASGASVVLQNSGGNNTTISANGSFTFSVQVANSAAYAVKVLTQPTGQTCAVTSGSGTVAGANVTSAHVSCTANTYTISGMVSGLSAGVAVTLVNLGGDPTTVKSNGSFTFATPVPYNGSYAITVVTQPPAQACTVTGGTGSHVTSNVSGGIVACGPAALSVIHSFNSTPDGNGPQASTIQGFDGNFYGTAYIGGTSSLGTVFKITPAGVEIVLHSFAGGATDGSFPTAGLIQGSDGNFYGTTANGGPTGNGTVFEITPSGTETLLYSFSGTDGGGPFGALVQGSDGNFYGTTSDGGPNFNGTVFKITPAGVMTMLHSFTGGPTDGRSPAAALIQGTDGNFYGTTQYGGASDIGTVFMITPAGVETVLHSFAGAEGFSPWAALLQASDGNFYGTTQSGGTIGYGTAFKLTATGVITVLHSFTEGTDGGGPSAALIQGKDGILYGTTRYGGTSGNGTVFKISAGVETVLLSFTGGTDGSVPYAALTQGSDGNFYGTTAFGGRSKCGNFIKITPAGIESVVYSFSSGPEGWNPGGLIQGSDGSLYGTTHQGGTNGMGTVFKITQAGDETVLHSFTGGATDGSYPGASLTQGSDGDFYGTTSTGGTSGNGTVFKITPAGVESMLHSFTGGATDGSAPNAALTQGGDGNFYGTTSLGGQSGSGTVFKVTPAGVETMLYSFTGSPTDGSAPNAALIQGSDGNFYGTTSSGGQSGNGTVFKIVSTGIETVLYSFLGGTGDGSGGFSALIQGNDGNFYGTSVGGGISNNGTIFKITPAGVETVLHFFEGIPDGSNPSAMAQGVDGFFYGATTTGGTSNLGAAFKF